MMSTDSAQHRTLTFTGTHGVMSRVGVQLRQFICGLHGHDSLLHFGEGRVSLLCPSCGHETPGWDVKSAPLRRETPKPERRVLQMPFGTERRVA